MEHRRLDAEPLTARSRAVRDIRAAPAAFSEHRGRHGHRIGTGKRFRSFRHARRNRSGRPGRFAVPQERRNACHRGRIRMRQVRFVQIGHETPSRQCPDQRQNAHRRQGHCPVYRKTDAQAAWFPVFHAVSGPHDHAEPHDPHREADHGSRAETPQDEPGRCAKTGRGDAPPRRHRRSSPADALAAALFFRRDAPAVRACHRAGPEPAHPLRRRTHYGAGCDRTSADARPAA